MIVSFGCRDTMDLANGDRVLRFQAIEKVARRKLRQLEIAGQLDDLRICFRWTPLGPAEVEIVDYH